jgi:DNA helicase-2/ATP-dependent DNA helicase PcrA
VASDPEQLSLDDTTLPARASVPARRAPTALAVTSLVSYRRCPKQFYWSVVRPLPRRSSAAARLGADVHRWIELRSGRQLALIEPEDELDEPMAAEGLPPAAASGAVASEPAVATESAATALKQSFLGSPYAQLDPRRVEAPFVLARSPFVVRGRVDAVYERDGRTDLVDFKTGREPETGDPAAHAQLELYALAAVDTWREDVSTLRTTYCYLRADAPATLVSRDWNEAMLEDARAGLAHMIGELERGAFGVNPGGWCARCDFVDVCPAGQAAVRL